MADTFLYFAYGSNMLTRRLTAKERAPSATREGIGFVKEHRLTFDKVSKKDGSGKCDIEKTGNPTDRVYGVLFKIKKSEEEALDKAEGCGKGYCKGYVQVVTADGEVEALTYIATNKNRELRPYHWYKALTVAGAVEHGLPNAYIEWLRTVDSIPEQESYRRAKEEALLFAPETDGFESG